MRLNAKQLRDLPIEQSMGQITNTERNKLYILLENVYDTYNIGGLFRLSDALNVAHIYIIGDSETPPNSKILKASIGTYKVVPWTYFKTSQEAILHVREVETGIKIYAVEQDANSVDYRSVTYSEPCAFLVGNETYGVLPETITLCDQTIEIPMWGINKSLNVIVSAAIATYWAAGQMYTHRC